MEISRPERYNDIVWWRNPLALTGLNTFAHTFILLSMVFYWLIGEYIADWKV